MKMSVKQIIGSTLAYATFFFIGSFAWLAFKIFLLNKYDHKFGPMGSFWLGVIVCLFAIPSSAAGYALPVLALRSRADAKSNWYPMAVAGMGAVVVITAAAFGGIGWLSGCLPFRMQTNLILTNVLTGIAAGSIAAILGWLFSQKRTA